jgi:hypothetical protein
MTRERDYEAFYTGLRAFFTRFPAQRSREHKGIEFARSVVTQKTVHQNDETFHVRCEAPRKNGAKKRL